MSSGSGSIAARATRARCASARRSGRSASSSRCAASVSTSRSRPAARSRRGRSAARSPRMPRARSPMRSSRSATARRLTDPLPPPASGHEVERIFGLVAPLGVAPPAVTPLPVFEPPRQWRDDARAWLAAAGIAPGGYVVLGLSARDAPKVPSREQVLRWAERTAARVGLRHAAAVHAGRRRQSALPRQRCAGARRSWPPRRLTSRACPTACPRRSASSASPGRSVLPDSGLMHFAAASPGGVVGLFADCARLSSPAQWGPRGPRAVALEAAARRRGARRRDRVRRARAAARLEVGSDTTFPGSGVRHYFHLRRGFSWRALQEK